MSSVPASSPLKKASTHIDFASSPRPTIGVEWEFALVDAQTRDLSNEAPGVIAQLAGRMALVTSDSAHAMLLARGEIARTVKLCHNLFLGVAIQSLAEVTVLAEKAGVSRHAFLECINNSVMGSTFTRYKAPALINLDFTTTFPPTGQRKDIDLGLALGREYNVPMPVTAATREVIQSHFGTATLQKDPAAYLEKDFAAMMETMALAAGMKLESEDKNVPTGLEH